MRKLKITLYKDGDRGSFFVKSGRYFDQPREWTSTLDLQFPWKACKFKNYKAKDCLAMYCELI